MKLKRLFMFAVSQNQFGRFLPSLRGRWNQFDSALAELRVAFFLHRNGFKILEWEPRGAAEYQGEFTIAGPSRRSVFAEVKSPGWEGELTPEELKAGRQHEPKNRYCEGRSSAPWERVQFEVRKAYKKFNPQNHNLLVLADDLFVGLQHGTNVWANYALYSRKTGGCFADEGFENLGGIGFFWVVAGREPVAYEMRIFVNSHAVSSAALPNDLRRAFQSETKIQDSAFRVRADNRDDTQILVKTRETLTVAKSGQTLTNPTDGGSDTELWDTLNGKNW